MMDRRAALFALLVAASGGAAAGETAMYGRVGKVKAQAGQRDALIAALAMGNATMPGNIRYDILRDAGDPDGIWIWELWDSQASHQASLALPEVKEAIRIGRPLIAGFEISAELAP